MFLTTAEGVFVDYHAKDVSQLYAHPSAFLGKKIKDAMPAPVSERLLQACRACDDGRSYLSVRVRVERRWCRALLRNMRRPL